MHNIDCLPIILKSDYLYNEKTGNGFVVRSQVFLNGMVIDTLPLHISDDLVYDVLNGDRISKLKSFKQISVVKKVLTSNSHEDIALQSFPSPILSNFNLKGGNFIESTNEYQLSKIRREKKTMAHAEVIYQKELIGEPQIIFEYSVITNFLSGGYGENSFISKTEKKFIDTFEKLPANERKEYYDNLKKKMTNSPR